jgi:hypothetical protein
MTPFPCKTSFLLFLSPDSPIAIHRHTARFEFVQPSQANTMYFVKSIHDIAVKNGDLTQSNRYILPGIIAGLHWT